MFFFFIFILGGFRVLGFRFYFGYFTRFFCDKKCDLICF